MAEDNAGILRDILQGRRGPKRDVVCLNTAPALVAGGFAKTLHEGYQQAAKVIDSGAAAQKLEKLVEFTNK
jgi:anthranilate phosphoribosyltransferase